MVEQAAVARWFQNDNQDRGSVRLELRLQKLVWDEYTDVIMWRPVVQVEIELNVANDSRTFVQQIFTSGKQKGEWLRKFWGLINNDFPPQYTRLIYRVMLIALDKAMADLTQHLTALPESPAPPTQSHLPSSPPW